MREPRLGDDIDDYCVRCKRIMNHSIVSVVNAEPAKVRCRICHSDHDFRHELAPPPKVDARKQALFNEVLKKANPMAAAVVEDAVEDPVEDVVKEPEELLIETALEVEAIAVAAPPAAKPKSKAPAAKPRPTAKPKAAANPKAKARK